MLRLFVALAFPEDIAARLDALTGGVPGADWVESDNYHLTLRFVGETPEDRAEDLAYALLGVRAEPFDIEFAGVGHFATGDEVRALWAGLRKSPALEALHHKIEEACRRQGFEPSPRKFTPHVTLARLKEAPLAKVQDFLVHNALFKAGPVRVDRFALFSSLRRAGGSVYTQEAEFFLRS
jgi:RNA 2',3'-cyclic 3'-phosphodiesterase